MTLVQHRLEKHLDTWDAFSAQHPELFNKENPILQNHYTKQTLESDKARTTYIVPELAPFVT